MVNLTELFPAPVGPINLERRDEVQKEIVRTNHARDDNVLVRNIMP